MVIRKRFIHKTNLEPVPDTATCQLLADDGSVGFFQHRFLIQYRRLYLSSDLLHAPIGKSVLQIYSAWRGGGGGGGGGDESYASATTTSPEGTDSRMRCRTWHDS